VTYPSSTDFVDWAADAEPFSPVRLDRTADRAAVCTDLDGAPLPLTELGWPSTDPSPRSRFSRGAEDAGWATGLVLIVAGVGALAVASVLGGGGSGGTGLGSGSPFVRIPGGWRAANRPEAVDWSEKPAVRIAPGGPLRGLPADLAWAGRRSRAGVVLRLGRERLELHRTVRRDGDVWWVDGPGRLRQGEAPAEPAWSVGYDRIRDVRVLRTADGEVRRRLLVEVAFDDGSELRLVPEDLTRLPVLLRYRAGLPGPWDTARTPWT